MEIFNFPNHGNPEFVPENNSPSIQLSGGFKFAAEPSEPIIRVFKLRFKAMGWFQNEAGQVDATIDPENNLLALWNFYLTHGTWKTFLYPHPVFGNVRVKFDEPFTIPEVSGNRGYVTGLEVRLREHT